MKFASGNNMLDVDESEVYVVLTVNRGKHRWCGSIQHARPKMDHVIASYCLNMAVSNLPARIVEVRHG